MINIFSKKSVGIDIADQTIEAAEVIKTGTKRRVSSLGRVLLEPGIVERGRIKDEKKLLEAVKRSLANAKPKSIVKKEIIFGLPESQVYTHIFKLKPHRKKQREILILKEVQKNIPLKIEDLLFYYKVLEETKDSIEILLITTSRKVVLEWQQFFQKLGLEVELFDIESLAIFRGLSVKPSKTPVCLVDIGSRVTNIAIFDKKGLRYSRSIDVAGDVFTKEIAKALKIKEEEAEKQKIKIGLSNKNNQISPILIKALEPISRELKTLLNYFQEKTGQSIEEIILIGGSSKLKGIVNYFNIDIGLPVILGKSIFLKDKIPLEYIEAVGLALRAWFKKDPAIYIKSLKSHRKALGFLWCRKKTKEIKKTEKQAEIITRPQTDKLRKQKILLVSILIIGLVIIGLAYWYRSYEKAKKQEAESQAAQYTETQSFDLKIPIAVDSSEYTSDRAKARIIEDIIEVAGDYNEAVAHSRITVEKELKEGESLWLTPINAEQNVFPMTIKWVVYSEKDANELFLKEIDKLNKDKRDYMLNNIEKIDLEPTDNPNIFYLTGKVTISLNQLIEIKQEEKEEEVPEEITMVVIEDTSTGWLRVREGPGTNYAEIDKVYPGETYSLLEEKDNWYKIEISNGIFGWISATYAEKL